MPPNAFLIASQFGKSLVVRLYDVTSATAAQTATCNASTLRRRTVISVAATTRTYAKVRCASSHVDDALDVHASDTTVHTSSRTSAVISVRSSKARRARPSKAATATTHAATSATQLQLLA